MPTKLTYKYVYDFIKNNGEELITQEYQNTKKMLEIKCKNCNSIYLQTFDRYNRGFFHQYCIKGKSGGLGPPIRLSTKTCIYCKKIFQPRRNVQLLYNIECQQLYQKTLKYRDGQRENGRKGGINSMKILNRRSKAEIFFANLCISYFGNDDIKCNELIFTDKNGGKWDCDIFIDSLGIAILYNGIFHYKKVYKDQKLERMISKDRLKEKIIIDNGYTYYIVKDMGGFKQDFVTNEFYLFLHKLKFKNILIDIIRS